MPALHAHPLILARILDELGGLDSASREATEWLLRDPALTAQALENHAGALDRSEPSILLEGISTKDLKHWIALASVKAQGHSPVSSLQHDWEQSLACAHYCQGLARLLGYPSEKDAYLAGLLHNLDRYAASPNPAHPRPGPSFTRVARWAAGWPHCAPLSGALLAQAEADDRLSEALPLARLLRVARASVQGEGDTYRLAATLLPELAPDALDGIRRESDRAVASLKHRLAGTGQQYPSGDYIKPLQERLTAVLADYLLIEQIRDGLADARTEAQVLDAVMATLEQQIQIRQPCYLVLDRAAGTLQPHPGNRHGHPGLRIRVQGSNSAAAWALTSRVPVVFSTRDAESVSVLDIQLAWQAGAGAVVAIPVGEFEIEGVLLGSASQQQGLSLELTTAYLSRMGRLLGRTLKRVRDSQESTGPGTDDKAVRFKAKAQRAAHEINNPLGIVRNYLAILGGKLAVQAEAANELGIIRQELERIPRILRWLTTDENGLPTSWESCDINTVIRDLATVAESALPAGRQIRIATQAEPGLPTLRTDPNKLKQLLLNLILNALDACPDEGRISIETYSNIDLQGDRQVLITVSDNGPGIAPEKLSRLFEPLGTNKGGQHAGLGLAIVKTLATELGMTVACRSNEHGTTFQIAASAN